jgi:hypothetical protein
MVRVNLTSLSNQIMPQYLKSMDYCCQFKVVGWVMLLMLP